MTVSLFLESINIILTVGPPTEQLQGYQEEELAVRRSQLPHWFHNFITKYSELNLDTCNIFLFMSYYGGGWL